MKHAAWLILFPASVLVVLAWDGARARLAQEISARGAGCRVLQVARDAATAPPPVAGDPFRRTVLTVAGIRSGKELAL